MTKTLSTRSVLSVASGRHCGGEFSEIHEAITHILGWDVFTHELAEKEVWEEARESALRSCPGIEVFATRAEATSSLIAISEIVQEAERVLGLSLEVEEGMGVRREHPLASLTRIAPDKPIIVIEKGGR